MGSLKSVPEEFHDKGLEKLFDISNFTTMTYEEQMDYLAKFHAELDRAQLNLKPLSTRGISLGLPSAAKKAVKKAAKKKLLRPQPN